jgi:anthranilate phosphoribosyltransferase
VNYAAAVRRECRDSGRNSRKQYSAPKRDLAIVNGAGGFLVAALAHCLASGIELAREQIDSGRALEKLRALQNYDGKVSI